MQGNRETVRNKRILLCPTEIGGNMQLLAQEFRRTGYHATAMAYCSTPLGYINDVNCGLTGRSRLKNHWARALCTMWAATFYDIFHFFFGQSLYDASVLRHADVRLLRRLGKKVFVHFRGSDVISGRYVDYMRATALGSTIREPPISDERQKRSLAVWKHFAHRLMVSYPLLLKAVPDAVLVSQAIDCDKWQPENGCCRRNGEVRVVHAPTNRMKKGTDLICDVVAKLRHHGYRIRLDLVENVPHSKVKERYRDADIGIDQLLYGWYGNFSIECMALGKPVICHIDPSLTQYAQDLPIVRADVTNLERKLIWLAEDAARRADLGVKGVEYVRKKHDVRIIADQCLNVYERSIVSNRSR